MTRRPLDYLELYAALISSAIGLLLAAIGADCGLPSEDVHCDSTGRGLEMLNYFKEIHMAILKLRSITCLEQAETFTDELYVTFNGTKRSLPNMTKGQTKALSDEFIFEGSRQLSLFENDGDHWYDRDDFIAKHTITQSPADLALDFEATSGNAIGAHYALDVSITPGP